MSGFWGAFVIFIVPLSGSRVVWACRSSAIGLFQLHLQYSFLKPMQTSRKKHSRGMQTWPHNYLGGKLEALLNIQSTAGGNLGWRSSQTDFPAPSRHTCLDQARRLKFASLWYNADNKILRTPSPNFPVLLLWPMLAPCCDSGKCYVCHVKFWEEEEGCRWLVSLPFMVASQQFALRNNCGYPRAVACLRYRC